MGRIVTTWEENGMLYTITATPITKNQTPTSSGNKTEMISVFEYLGGTPPNGTGEKVYKYAISIGAKIDTKAVSSTKYTGKVMLYERQMLDVYFNADTTTIKAPDTNYVAKPAVISQTYNESDELDLPF